MNNSLQMTVVLAITVFPACQGMAGWSNQDALAAESIEFQLSGAGTLLEVEYHVPPDQVPAAIRAAMDELHPGGEIVAAEKEYVGATLYWEVTKRVDGRDVEAMFTVDGALHSEELEVPASEVPASVQEAVRDRLPGGTTTKWEEIRDGSRELVEFHAKTTLDEARYKVVVGIDGVVLRVLREIQAEVEVPVA